MISLASKGSWISHRLPIIDYLSTDTHSGGPLGTGLKKYIEADYSRLRILLTESFFFL